MKEFFVVLSFPCNHCGGYQSSLYVQAANQQTAAETALAQPWNGTAYQADVYLSAEDWARQKGRRFAMQVPEKVPAGVEKW